MTASRYIPAKAWARKPQARHFRIRDEAKAATKAKAWAKKSKRK